MRSANPEASVLTINVLLARTGAGIRLVIIVRRHYISEILHQNIGLGEQKTVK